MLTTDELVDRLIDLSFAEDIGDGDHTTLCCIPEDAMGRSHLLIKEDGILAGVDSGRFDIACNGVGYTEKRAEAYNFSTPYVYTEMVLVVGADNEEIKSLEDLKGKKTANSPNSTYAMRSEAAGAEVVYVDTLGETMEMLQQGRVDATLNAKDSVDAYLAEHPEAAIKIVLSVAGEPVAIPMQKGEGTATLKAEIDRILEEARQNGKLAELSMKYFGRDLTVEGK